MGSNSQKQIWETFVRRPKDIREGEEIPLALRDLTPGRRKYQFRNVVAVVSRRPEELRSMDTLQVRTVVGVLLPEPFGVRIIRDLPIEISGSPYRDFFQALEAAAWVKGEHAGSG